MVFYYQYLDLNNKYEILNGLSSLTPIDYFLLCHYIIISTRSYIPYLLRPLYTSSKPHLNIFFHRSVDAGNPLPSNYKILSSFHSFELTIKLVDLSAFCFLKFSVFESTISCCFITLHLYIMAGCL